VIVQVYRYTGYFPAGSRMDGHFFIISVIRSLNFCSYSLHDVKTRDLLHDCYLPNSCIFSPKYCKFALRKLLTKFFSACI